MAMETEQDKTLKALQIAIQMEIEGKEGGNGREENR